MTTITIKGTDQFGNEVEETLDLSDCPNLLNALRKSFARSPDPRSSQAGQAVQAADTLPNRAEEAV